MTDSPVANLLGGTEDSKPREYLRVLVERGEGAQPVMGPEAPEVAASPYAGDLTERRAH